MRSVVQKWGNSLAVRIPKSFAVDLGLAENAAVELSVAEGRLVVEPRREAPLRLEDLLGAITDANLPGVWETGPAVGKEVW